MPSIRQLLTLGLLMTIPICNLKLSRRPPRPTIEHRETRHGATVVDPYFWLREKSNPEVVQVSGGGERLHRRR